MRKTLSAVGLAAVLALGTGGEVIPAWARRGADDFLEQGTGSSRGGGQSHREFYGTVQQLPPQAHIGVWMIDGREVHVTPQTELDFRGGPVRVGTVVKVKGGTVEGRFIAREIKTRRRQ